MDSSSEDRALIERVLQGESKLFSQLVERYQRFIYAANYAMLGNCQDAEDVTQEVFVSAFRKLPSYEGRASFLTWLRKIAFHASIDFRRRQKSRGVSSHLVDAECIASIAAKSPVHQFETNELVESVRGCIDMLPEDQREIVMLRDLEELDYSEIAEVLSIPIGTVRSRLHRARIELKSILERRGIGIDLANAKRERNHDE